VRLLLDTQIAIWTIGQPNKLDVPTRDLIASPKTAVFVSVVTIWEIAIKYPLRKTSAPPFSARDGIAHFARAGFTLLEVKPEHAVAVETLPLHHGDPFDRLLVAQALTEPLRLVTADKRLTAYSNTVMLC